MPDPISSSPLRPITPLPPTTSAQPTERAGGDDFALKVFVFRWVCGIVFTLVYAFRGFAPAVWTHALYHIWVLVF